MSAETETIEYVVLVAGGLEDVAVAEVADVLGLRAESIERICVPPATSNWADDRSTPLEVFPGEAGVGKLLFKLPAPSTRAEWVAQHEALASLQCTCGLYAPLAMASGLALASSGLEEVKAAVSNSHRWPAALHTWRCCRLDPPKDVTAASVPVDDLSFRASAVRDGTHEFKSVALAQVRCRNGESVSGWSLSRLSSAKRLPITRDVSRVRRPSAPRCLRAARCESSCEASTWRWWRSCSKVLGPMIMPGACLALASYPLYPCPCTHAPLALFPLRPSPCTLSRASLPSRLAWRSCCGRQQASPSGRGSPDAPSLAAWRVAHGAHR